MARQSQRNLTAYEQIDQRFATGQVLAVTEYINSIKFPVNITTSDDSYIPEKPESEQHALWQNSDVYLDSGEGRVSKGLRGLELLSRLCKGVAPDSLYLFSNVIYYSDAHAVKSASDERLIEIISANLGMNFIEAAAEPIAPGEVTKFKTLCKSIGYQVRSGVFKKEDYKTRVLQSAKKLAVAAARNPTGKK